MASTLTNGNDWAKSASALYWRVTPTSFIACFTVGRKATVSFSVVLVLK